MPDIKYVYDYESGDWEGLYVDGRLAAQTHSLEADEVLEVLGVGYECVRASASATGGRFPERFADVVTAREAKRRDILEEAARLREQAEALEAEAADVL